MSEENYPLLSRLGARIIDGILIAIIGIIAFDGIIIYVFYLFYHIIMHLFYGQTIGKKIFGIKLISVKGNQINKFMLVIRETLVLLSFYYIEILRYIRFNISYSNILRYTKINVIIGSIILFVMLTNKYHRALHDLLTGTKVIRISKGISKYIDF